MNTIEILERLIGFPTVSADSNLALIDWVEAYLRERGVECRRSYDAGQGKANLLATVVPGDGGIVLSGHTDVVPVTGQAWSSDPFRVELRDGRIYGRGACDMKGFIAAALAAVPAIRSRAGSRPLHLALSYDEEVGCRGAPQLVEGLIKLGIRPRGCVVGEPTGMRIIVGHKGAGMYRCRVSGRAAHSSLAPFGVNAIEIAARIVAETRAIAAQIERTEPRDESFDVPHSTIQVNRISGGTAGNIVADSCEMLIDIRNLAATNRDALLTKLETVIESGVLADARKVAPEADVVFEQLADIPAFENDPASPFVREISRSNSVERDYAKVAFGSEAGLFQQAGIATVLCGPGSIEQAHAPDEFVTLDQLERCDRMLLDLTTG